MSTCLSVQPGVIDFPARCKLPRDHFEKRHAARDGAGGEITWEDE